MKRPNQYSKPLAGARKESYHPADYAHNQYADDLNKYIDHLEAKVKAYESESKTKAVDGGSDLLVDFISIHKEGHAECYIELLLRIAKSKRK